ncbi:unnamed protein product [Pleuronectes platessa]|uniref:Uncharacterized protein n=1 Tax=Pleuronectes platessa TaxID=8262 RepID=A0A9N7Y8E6_PLEPL|nr:unnamed protein product [Pleuronectes platessa]
MVVKAGSEEGTVTSLAAAPADCGLPLLPFSVHDPISARQEVILPRDAFRWRPPGRLHSGHAGELNNSSLFQHVTAATQCPHELSAAPVLRFDAARRIFLCFDAGKPICLERARLGVN